jgi:hypothetical protein
MHPWNVRLSNGFRRARPRRQPTICALFSHRSPQRYLALRELERSRWVLEPIASKVVLMGGSGAGHSTKLLSNFLNAVSLAATAGRSASRA